MTAIEYELIEASDDLASGIGSESSIEFLEDGNITVRLILLAKLVDALLSNHKQDAVIAGLPAVLEALEKLRSMEAEEFRALISYPHTGSWLSYACRRIFDDRQDGISSVPLSADIGYLGWLVASGLIATTAEGSIELTIRHGVIMLPRIGLARLGNSGQHGQCNLYWTEDGGMRFTSEWGVLQVNCPKSEDNPAWLPLRRLSGGSSESKSVYLDDIDPFRDFAEADIVEYQRNPPRLTLVEAAPWQQRFEAAWGLLEKDFASYTIPMQRSLAMIVPLTAEYDPCSVSYTSHNGYGAVYTTAPPDCCELAVTLIHEIQHTKFTLLTDQVILHDSNQECHLYAPWRQDPRPIAGLMHGIYAFFGIADFWRVHRKSPCHRSLRADSEFERWRIQVEAAIAVALESGLLTPEGTRFLCTLTGSIRKWDSEEVSIEAKQDAQIVSNAHRAFWRVRNLRPASEAIASLCDDWITKNHRTAALPDSELIDQNGIPDNYARARIPERIPENSLTYCIAKYTESLRIDPMDPRAWAGLTLALPMKYPELNFHVLEERTEVVAHMYETIQLTSGDCDIVSLAQWLSSSVVHR
ncbi:HEXXH motif domain-containing protein [Nocardia sp. NPDC058058]|uniref:HEXXH motif domain-containing protein n=1 Tax=Nocardia sp. NPDC058058 TaxID=3346317 RepID=UPI0036DD1F0C